MLILIMMIGGMKKLLPNLNNQRVHHLINPFSLATMITTINLRHLQIGHVFK